MEIKCRFGSFFLNKSDYSCIVTEVKITGPGQAIEEVKGDHEVGKSNADVTAFICRQKRLERFPRGLSNYFPNLVKFQLLKGRIKEISSQDLEGLEKLKVIYMQNCILTSLPNDLFHNMPDLEEISFDSNQIESASSNFLKPFVGRPKIAVNLRRNKNIDAWYDSTKQDMLHSEYQKLSLEELMKAIDKNCIKPQKPQQLSSHKPHSFVDIEKVKNLWITGLFSDMKIISRGTEFKAHRAILAIRSPALADLLTKDTKEMTINGVSPDAVRSALHFMYTNEILKDSTSQDNAKESLAIAHSFKMQDMKSAYEEIISNKLNDSNAYDTFLFAHQNEAKDLKQKAINLIAKKLAPLPISFTDDPVKLKELIDYRSGYDKLLEKK